MHHRPQLKALFVVFALTLLFMSPLIIVFGPMFFPITFFYEKHTWFYYTPSTNYWLYGFAIVLLILACCIMLAVRSKFISISLSVILSLIALTLFAAGSISYMKATPKGMTLREPFELKEHYYKWSEFEKVEYFSLDTNASGIAKFEVTFEDGRVYTFSETEHVKVARSSMQMMWRKYDVEIVYSQLP